MGEDNAAYVSLGWRDELWDVVRYYRSIGNNNKKMQNTWLEGLKGEGALPVLGKDKKSKQIICHGNVPLKQDTVNTFLSYLEWSKGKLETMINDLRTEEDALAFCRDLSIKVSKTATQSKDHHQSSKSLIAAVTAIATEFCADKGVDLEPDPQGRCAWFTQNHLHITARNLDGAIPNLVNPKIIWEIKEYWGKTKGGSKMSDAVYECQLVGRELREFEESSGMSICHVVFLDGKEQWGYRRSDLVRFLDLESQGLIDHLVVGRQVETEWKSILEKEAT
nr:hypothetical protein 3 [bacterium]